MSPMVVVLPNLRGLLLGIAPSISVWQATTPVTESVTPSTKGEDPLRVVDAFSLKKLVTRVWSVT
jgi:hypothetical protein